MANKHLLNGTRKSTSYSVMVYMGKSVKKSGCMYCITDSLCCTHETNTTLWINYFVVVAQLSSPSSSLQSHGLQHARLPCPSLSPRVCSSSYPLSQWCDPAISSSVIPFSSCLQYFLASGSFPTSQFFTWSGQSIAVSASALVLPMNIQDWFPFRWTGLISLQSNGLSRVFFNTTIQKHSLALSFLCGPTVSFIHDYWKKTQLWLGRPLSVK